MASTGDVPTRTPTIPRILPPKPLDPASTPKDFICAVCYELPLSASDALVTPCCQHVFCAGCIKVSLQTKRECPFDRKKLRSRELNRLDGLSRRVFESIPVTCPIEDWSNQNSVTTEPSDTNTCQQTSRPNKPNTPKTSACTPVDRMTKESSTPSATTNHRQSSAQTQDKRRSMVSPS